MTKIGLCSFILLVITIYHTDAFLFKKGWNEKNCFCKIVDNSNYGNVLKDFGKIQGCKGWAGCGCRRSAMITCGTECERKVKEWTRDHCPTNLKGRKVRAFYQASVCNKGYGHQVYDCGNMCLCPCQG